jgi:subtilisin family serine protease
MTIQLDEDHDERLREQIEIIRAALRVADPDDDTQSAIEIAHERSGPDGVAYVFQDCGVLVHEDHVEAANQRWGKHPETPPIPRRPGMQLLRLRERGALNAVREIRAACGDGAAALNHIMCITDGSANLCPADEPIPASGGSRPPLATGASGHAGRGVRVRVIDTGLLPAVLQAHPDYDHNTGGRPRLTVPYRLGGQPPMPADPDPDAIPIYRGHGTFIAGLIRCVAPGATIYVGNLFRRGGALAEMNFVDHLRDLLEGDPDEMPDIISLSAGVYHMRAYRCGELARVVDDLQEYAGTHGKPLLVAAAGNDGRPGDAQDGEDFLPAAMSGVVSVGALRADLTGRACFSNHGRHAKVYAPGERLVNIFPGGSYRYRHDGLETCRYLRRSQPQWYPCCTCVTQPNKDHTAAFLGMAEWSGTSFATPIVAGLIAARMTRSSENGHAENAYQAAQWLLDHPATSIDDLGPVLLPDQYVG